MGGRESNVVPVSSADPRGYTPPSKEYDPASPGTVGEQTAAGTMPPTSPVFVMDITYDAYLGLYIGEPQNVEQDGKAPQQFYATGSLATQKWRLIGDTGSHTNASWYRWFLDSANRTSSAVVGKDFRSYCSFGCSGGSSGEYLDVTIGTSAPAAPVDSGRTYRIGAGNGRVLAQAPGGSATTSLRGPAGTGRAAWVFTSDGDGSYRITNAATGRLLGVDDTSTRGRAWGARPTVTAAGSDGRPTVGHQWFVLPGRSAAGRPDGTYRLVNRYSGLVIGLSADVRRGAETAPVRTWSDTTRTTVGAGRTASEQTLRLTPAKA